MSEATTFADAGGYEASFVIFGAPFDVRRCSGGSPLPLREEILSLNRTVRFSTRFEDTASLGRLGVAERLDGGFASTRSDGMYGYFGGR